MKKMIGRDSTVEARGFYGHQGRKGQRGGSLPRSGGSSTVNSPDQDFDTGYGDKGAGPDRVGKTPGRLDKALLSWMKVWYRVNQKSAKRTGKKFNVPFKTFVQNPTMHAIVGEPTRSYRRPR
jgi:hypothetical protein